MSICCYPCDLIGRACYEGLGDTTITEFCLNLVTFGCYQYCHKQNDPTDFYKFHNDQARANIPRQ